MNPNSRKVEWLMTLSGVLTAAPTHTLILFLVVFIVGDEQIQNNGDAISFWVVGLFVPIGALMGVLASGFSMQRQGIITPSWQMFAGSWFVSTLCGYPVSIIWTAIFSFNMPSPAIAAAISAIYVLIALGLCVACSSFIHK